MKSDVITTKRLIKEKLNLYPEIISHLQIVLLDEIVNGTFHGRNKISKRYQDICHEYKNTRDLWEDITV